MACFLLGSVEALADMGDGVAVKLGYPRLAQAQQGGEFAEGHAMIVMLDHNRTLRFAQMRDLGREPMLEVAPCIGFISIQTSKA